MVRAFMARAASLNIKPFLAKPIDTSRGMGFARDLAPVLNLIFADCDRPVRRQDPSDGYKGCSKLKTV
jgi:hypothetical protein